MADGSNGGLAANYSISAGQTTTANITPKALTVSGITASNKTYDGSTNVTLTGTAVYSGLVMVIHLMELTQEHSLIRTLVLERQ